MSWKDFYEHISLIMGLLSFSGGVIFWFSGQIKRRYGLERDFNHLKRNYEALTGNVATLDKMLDERLDRFELMLVKIESLLAASRLRGGEGTSSPRLD